MKTTLIFAFNSATFTPVKSLFSFISKGVIEIGNFQRRWLPRELDLLYGLAVVVFRRVSWLLFGARQHPSFLDSDPIRLTALAPLFTLSLVGMARRFYSFTVPHNHTLCGAKLPLLSPSGSPLLPRICEDMDCLQSRPEG
jgi:hypothetical protein